jgi:hypothetical protein
MKNRHVLKALLCGGALATCGAATDTDYTTIRTRFQEVPAPHGVDGAGGVASLAVD